jgi:hypothetical protein
VQVTRQKDGKFEVSTTECVSGKREGPTILRIVPARQSISDKKRRVASSSSTSEKRAGDTGENRDIKSAHQKGARGQ